MEGLTLAGALVSCLITINQAEMENNQQEIKNQPSVITTNPKRKMMAFTIPGFQRGQPVGSLDPWWYGYNFGDNAAGYYGGGNYTRYYAYTRGFPSIGDFPGPVPGRVWTNDPKRTPFLHQMPHFTQPGNYPDGPVMRGAKQAQSKEIEPDKITKDSGVNMENENSRLTARISIKIPSNAKITIEGVPTRQSGEYREFISPELIEDIDYVYHLNAEWLNGSNDLVRREARVVLRAGSHQVVMFNNVNNMALIERIK